MLQNRRRTDTKGRCIRPPDIAPVSWRRHRSIEDKNGKKAPKDEDERPTLKRRDNQ